MHPHGDPHPGGGFGRRFENCGERKVETKRGRRLKSFLIRKDGHVFAFVYPPEHELAALKALADCPNLEPADVLALVCYLGRDPRELGEELF